MITSNTKVTKVTKLRISSSCSQPSWLRMPHPASDHQTHRREKNNIRAELWVQPLWIPTKASGGRPGWETSKCRLRDRGGLEDPTACFAVHWMKAMTLAIDISSFGWDSQVNGPNALHPRSLRSCGKWFTPWLVILAAWIEFSSLTLHPSKRIPGSSNKAAVKHRKITCPAHLHVDEKTRGHPGCNQNAWGNKWTGPRNPLVQQIFQNVWISYCQWNSERNIMM